MADDLSLLFRIRGDASSAKAATAEARAAVAQLRQSFGPELAQTVSVTNKAFSEVADNLNVFVGQRIPLVGGAFLRVTENIRNFGDEARKQEESIKKIASTIGELSTQTGKSVPQITAFLVDFAKIEGQANRDAAALKFFGAEVLASNTKLIPTLEETAAGLSEVAVESEAAGAGIASMATPIGFAVVAVGALAFAAAAVAKELVEVTKRAAEFEGKMQDLSQQTGLAVETLSALEIVAKTTGGNIDQIAQSVFNFQRKLEEAQEPSSKIAETFKKLGIETKDTESALRQSFAALAKMPEGFNQVDAAAQLFGARGGKQILALLKEADGDIDAVIKRARELGILITTDEARAADKFNDELEILQLQLRAAEGELARELIPALLEVIRAFSSLVSASRPLLDAFGQIAGPVVRSAASALRGLGIVVAALTGNYVALAKAIKDANDEANAAEAFPIPAQKVPSPQPVHLPGAPTAVETATEAVRNADAVVAAAKRAADAANQALDESFAKGRISRQRAAQETIDFNKKVLDAETARIDAVITQKEKELQELDRESDAFKKTYDEIRKLQQDRLNAENTFEVSSSAIRAKANKERADAQRNQVQNETDILIGELGRQNKAIEAAIKAGTTPEAEGLTIIEQIERAKIEARQEGLEKQKRIGFLTIEQQKDLDNQIQQLNQEADRLADEQAARRLAREQETFEKQRQLQLQNIDALLGLIQISGQRQIDTQKALADARIITEQDAARKILKIRLDLIDTEIEATKAKLTATKSIVDVDERTAAQAELNNKIRVLNEERKSIDAQGERDIEEGRQKDLDNERRYQNELSQIKEDTVRIEREAAEEILRLMIIHFANRRDIVRARTQLDLQDEESEHQRVLAEIESLKQENEESKRSKEEKLRILEELNRLEEVEAERHRLAIEGIQAEGAKAEKLASPLGRLDLDTQDLERFASVIEDSVIPLGQLLTNTFQQVADAIGQTVANWVLLGDTGPAVMRKILAQALASIAAEAAVNAIKELALGFATLFYNPAESAAHFTAAGLWAAIGGVAAVAGRGLAGDLFKQKPAGSSGGNASSQPQQLNPLAIPRNQPAPHVTVVMSGEAAEAFNFKVTKVILDDHAKAGPIRETFANDGGRI